MDYLSKMVEGRPLISTIPNSLLFESQAVEEFRVKDCLALEEKIFLNIKGIFLLNLFDE